jgi:hypothetical protein
VSVLLSTEVILSAPATLLAQRALTVVILGCSSLSCARAAGSQCGSVEGGPSIEIGESLEIRLTVSENEVLPIKLNEGLWDLASDSDVSKVADGDVATAKLLGFGELEILLETGERIVASPIGLCE